ncbi:MAG: O-antigen ligase family protein [Candidatus Omnitrophota bacterium]
MAVGILALYILLELIRPMDWWEPMRLWPIINICAIATALIGMPSITARFKTIWNQIPQMKIALWFFAATVLSFLPQFYMGGMLYTFQNFGKVIFFFVLFLIIVKQTKEERLLIWLLLLGIIWLSIHAILQQRTGFGFGGKPPSPRGINPETGETIWQSRAYGTFDDPNDLSLILVVGIPLFIMQVFMTGNPVQKIVGIVGAGLAAYGTWCTNSRGGIVALLGMLGAFVFVRMKGIKRYLVGGIGGAIIMVLAPARFGSSGLSGRDRSILWGDGIAMFERSPIFGVGFGRFPDNASRPQVAHNSYVHVLAELGLVGYLPFFLLIYLTIIQLRRLIDMKRLISKNDYFLLTGLFAGLAGQLVAMYFISRQYQSILFINLALAIGTIYIISRDYNLLQSVYGQTRQDIRHGVFLGLGSIPVIWVTILLSNKVG